MFIRINTIRINCNAIALYEPQRNESAIKQVGADSCSILISFTAGHHDEIKFKSSDEMVKVLKKLDKLFEIKENLASNLPSRQN